MVHWTKRAAADLRAIRRYIAADNPNAAQSWIARIRSRALSASRVPNSGRIVREIVRSDIREVLVQSYRIVYRVVSKGIVVLTVIEGHKLLGNFDIEEKAKTTD